MSFTTRRLLSDSTSQYRIPNSLRFRPSASAYLSRTPAVAGNRTTWTWSGWVKMGNTYLGNPVFNAHGDQTTITRDVLYFRTDGRLDFFVNGIGSSFSGKKVSTSVFRDFSAWYHVVAVYDSTNPTAEDRMRLYVNGDRITTFDINISVPQNTTSKTNSTQIHRIGVDPFSGPPADYFDGYLTEVNFIDGQALDPLAFGYFSPTTGVWTPARYTGTYGTNGFYLKFTDTSSNTATGIGKDSSGNGNNWTPNNISLTAGTTYDSMIDTPTPYDDGGYGRGNYATFNPLHYNVLGTATSEGNLAGTSIATSTSPYNRSYPSTLNVSSGKWYCELTVGVNNNGQSIGITSAFDSNGIPASNNYSYNFWDRYYIINNVTAQSPYGVRATSGQVIGMAVNLDVGTIEWFVNGVSQGQKSGIVSGNYFIVYWPQWGVGGVAMYGTINFGQRPFAYTPPTGFKTLCTQNLPTPAIVNPAQFMAATTYAGTGATQTIANTVNNRSFQPDLVWIKGRSAATDHALYDSVRGATKDLVSNSTAAETTQATGLTTFGSTGFSIGNLAKLNTNAQTYVAWQWKAGDSTVTNTAGTITSQVDANPTAGFSIVSYTGNGVAGATVGHGLGVAPKMLIVKQTNVGGNSWSVYHSGLPSAAYGLVLEGTNAQFTTTFWNNTAPALNVFSIGGPTTGATNNNGSAYIAYCFAEVDGFSKFGSYTGNGSADGVFCYTGFRPKWVMIKRTDSTGPWFLQDSSRSKYNVILDSLLADQNVVENTIGGYDKMDFLSNGFKQRDSSLNANGSGGSYIFAAFAEAPFKYALAR